LLLVLNFIINRLINSLLRVVIDKFEKAGRGDLTQRLTSKGVKGLCPDGLQVRISLNPATESRAGRREKNGDRRESPVPMCRGY